MATLAEIRAQFPQYGDMSDVDLANALHAKYYADMPRNEFDNKIGLDPYAYEAEETRKALWGDRRPAKPGDEVSRDTILPFREIMGPDGKPKTELAVPGIVMEPARAAARLFGGVDYTKAGGIQPLHQMPKDMADALMGEAMTAGSVAMPGTTFPGVTTATQAALRAAQQLDDAFGPVISKEPPRPAGPPLGGSPRDELMAAAQRQGIKLPVALASDSDAVRGGAGRLVSIPGVGSPIVSSVQRAIEDTGARLAAEADRLSPARSEAAGRMIANDAARAVQQATQSPVDEIASSLGATTPSAAGARLSGEVGGVVDARTRAAVEGASRELGSGSRSGAGQAVRDSATDWIERRSADEAGAIYADVNAFMPGSGGRLTRTAAAIDDLVAGAEAAGLPPPPITNLLRQAAGPDGLSFEGLQSLRTHIGDMLSGRVTPEPNMNMRALDRVYASLSGDLRDMARGAMQDLAREQGGLEGRRRLTAAQRAEIEAAGERGVQLWDQANARFRDEIAARRTQLADIIGQRGDATPEAIVDRLAAMATSRGGGDIARLRTALDLISPEARRELLSAIVGRMGRYTDGFSQRRFRAEWEALSPEGRALLFGREGGIEQRLASAVAASRDLEPLATLVGMPAEAIVARIVRMAGDKSGADIAALRRLRGVVGPETWREVSGTAVASLGQDGGRFSPQTFRRNWSALSDEGRAVLLDGNQDTIARLTQASDAVERMAPIAALSSAGGEQIVQTITKLAQAKGGADIRQLQTLMESVAAQGSREAVAASVIRDMGGTKNGFSPARFRTELDKFSDAGRQTLFGPEVSAVLKDIDTISQRFEQLSKLGNPSGTGGTNAVLTVLGAAGTALATASVQPLVAAAGLVGGGLVLSKMLARPATARAVRDFAEAHAAALTGSAAATMRLRDATRRLEAAARAVAGQEMGGEMRDGTR